MTDVTPRADAHSEAQPDGGLRRALGTYDATMLVMGSMIGSGIFLVSAFMARGLGAPGWLLVAWVVTAVLTMTGALSYAELGAMRPRAGGAYRWISEAYSPLMGFLLGWTVFLVIQTGAIAALGIAFARFSGVFLPGISEDRYVIEPIALFGRYAISLSTGQLVAIGVITVLTWANTRGIDWGKLIQNFFTTSNTIALTGLILAGLLIGRDGAVWSANFGDLWSIRTADPIDGALSAASGAFGILVALAIAQMGSYFSATGWDNLAYTAGEVRDPGRTLPRALGIGVAAVLGLYLLVNVAYLAVLPFEAIQGAASDRVASVALEAVFPGVGALVMAGLIVIATFGCNNAQILAGARVYYAMARDGLFFAGMSRLNRARVPGRALLLQGAWAAFLVLPRTVVDAEAGTYGNVYSDLLDYTTFAALLSHAIGVSCVFRLRRKSPADPRPYRVSGYPFVPGLFIVVASGVLLALAVYRPWTTWPGLGIIALGVPVYYAFRRSRDRGFDAAGGGSTL